MQIDKDTSFTESRFQEHFKLHFNSTENKYRSIAFCYLNRVSVLGHEDHNAISIIAITKPQSYEYPITIALVYGSPNSPIASFLHQLVYFTNARIIDILLGDFNIDAFDGDTYTRLDEVLSSYRTDTPKWRIIGSCLLT